MHVEIPSSVTSIGEAAFWKCRSLTDIEISSGVTTIKFCVFTHCENLERITIQSSELAEVKEGAIDGISEKAVIIVPKGKDMRFVLHNYLDEK